MGLLKPKLDPAIKAKMERPGVRAFVSVDCIAGISGPANPLCQIYYLDDRIEVDTPDTEYSIPMERVRDVSIQQQHGRGVCGRTDCRTHGRYHRRQAERKTDGAQRIIFGDGVHWSGRRFGANGL